VIEDRFADVIDASRRVAWAKFYAERDFNSKLLADLQVLAGLILNAAAFDDVRLWALIVEHLYGQATPEQTERALLWAHRRYSIREADERDEL
jgi:hypothetical protein